MINHTADRWGIEPSYWDALGTEHFATEETRAALMRAMHADVGEPAPETGVRVIGPGSDLALHEPGELKLESGESFRLAGALPGDLPHGYHELVSDSGLRTWLIASPGQCYLPDLHLWGWAVQL